jgi:hypothetical protein
MFHDTSLSHHMVLAWLTELVDLSNHYRQPAKQVNMHSVVLKYLPALYKRDLIA